MQAYLREETHNDHMTVAVEFEATPTETEGHHHAGREIQLLELKHNGQTEEWLLVIE
jgi:nicotinic acid phosphoribosyltransferase